MTVSMEYMKRAVRAARLTRERKESAAEEMYEALKEIPAAFGDDEYLTEWATREDNQVGSKMGVYLTAEQIKRIFAALAKADGRTA